MCVRMCVCVLGKARFRAYQLHMSLPGLEFRAVVPRGVLWRLQAVSIGWNN